jgi:hypothetical protein
MQNATQTQVKEDLIEKIKELEEKKNAINQ